MTHITILGGGVSGLTTALVLRDRGHDVSIWCRARAEQTTSAVAAAVWYPYLVEPRDRVRRWAASSYVRFTSLAPLIPTIVFVRRSLEIGREGNAPPPLPEVPGARPAQPEELPVGHTSGQVLDLPVIVMPAYLAWLEGQLLGRGVAIATRAAASLAEVPGDLIVNCTGLGARELVGDALMRPIRGQNVRIRGTGTGPVLLDDMDPRGPTYLVPRADDRILGGTAETGNESLAVDPIAALEVYRRVATLDPSVLAAPILEIVVGIRPGRSEVRLETERLPDGRAVIHDYGHGGAGVTLSWGCAEEVAERVAEALEQPPRRRGRPA